MKNNRVKLVCGICAAISVGFYSVVIVGENQLYSSFSEAILLSTEEVKILRFVVAKFTRAFTQPLMVASIIINVASNVSLIKRTLNTFAYNFAICGAVYLIQVLTLKISNALLYNLEYLFFAFVTQSVVGIFFGVVTFFCREGIRKQS